MLQKSLFKQPTKKEEHAKKLFKIIEDNVELKNIIKEDVEDYKTELLEELYDKLENSAKEVFDAKIRIYKKQIIKEIMDELEQDCPCPKEEEFELDYDEYYNTELPNNKKEEQEEEFKLEMP